MRIETGVPSAPRARRAPLRSMAPLATLLALCSVAQAFTFDELNDAQRLVYARAHLASSGAGDLIDYRYRAQFEEGDPVEDSARLHVDAVVGEERRDVTLDFLSGARHLALPPFTGYRTNPVLIAMLEHVSQSLSAATGGGALYFRNRIRDALARDDTRIERGETTLATGDTVKSTTLVFEPFRDDAYLGARTGYAGATIRIVLSEAVPGGVVSVGASSGEAPAAESFDYELHFRDKPEGSATEDDGDDAER